MPMQKTPDFQAFSNIISPCLRFLPSRHDRPTTNVAIAVLFFHVSQQKQIDTRQMQSGRPRGKKCR
jgi:hypothetical protein